MTDSEFELVNKIETLGIELDHTHKLLQIFFTYCLEDSEGKWGKAFSTWPIEEQQELGDRVCRFAPLLDAVDDKIFEVSRKCEELSKLLAGGANEKTTQA